jgi:superfamily II DNA or RNA helicase
LTQAEQTFAHDNNVDLMLQSMMSQISDEYIKKGWDITVLDEAHHDACASFQYHLDKIGEKPLIGLTATPDRADQQLIKYDHIINPISREQAVAEGYLAETDIHSFVDLSGTDKNQILTDIFTDYGHQMGQTMVFVKTKKEVTAMTTVLQNLGYQAVAILNQTDKQLDALLDQFSRGEVQFLLNCAKIGEGVDVKGCTDVVLGRQLGSYSLLNQIIGRAARVDDPRCNVWELINPVSAKNMDSSVVVGTPKSHRLVSKRKGQWVEQEFNYQMHRSNRQLGMSSGKRAGWREPRFDSSSTVA